MMFIMRILPNCEFLRCLRVSPLSHRRESAPKSLALSALNFINYSKISVLRMLVLDLSATHVGPQVHGVHNEDFA